MYPPTTRDEARAILRDWRARWMRADGADDANAREAVEREYLAARAYLRRVGAVQPTLVALSLLARENDPPRA